MSRGRKRRREGDSLDEEACRWPCSQKKKKERGRGGVRYGSEGGD